MNFTFKNLQFGANCALENIKIIKINWKVQSKTGNLTGMQENCVVTSFDDKKNEKC